MTKPLITIGIACYNAKKTIARALDSALAQDYPNTEILVVDDSSSDGSISIVKEYEKKYPHIRHIIHEKNIGVGSTRNTILDNYTGEYLAFFDDDDKSLPARLTKQYEHLVNFHSDFALCWGHWRLVTPEGADLNKTWLGIGRKKPEPHGEIVTRYLLAGTKDPNFAWGKIGTSALMAHRNTFARIGEYDPTMFRGEDLESAIRASILGSYFISVDEMLLDYCYKEQKTQTTFKEWKTHCRIAHKYRHITPVSHMKFFRVNGCKYLNTVLKKNRDIKDYLQGIWTLTKLSPTAGIRFFFHPKNLLRMLRMPFVSLYKRIFKS